MNYGHRAPGCYMPRCQLERKTWHLRKPAWPIPPGSCENCGASASASAEPRALSPGQSINLLRVGLLAARCYGKFRAMGHGTV